MPDGNIRDEFVLAPLLGVTDVVYRQVFTQHFGGFHRAVAPFVKTLQGGRFKPSKMRELDPEDNKDLPIQPQIISNNSDDFLAVAQFLFEWGYTSLNLNLGCPVPMAAGRGRGAGLLGQPDFLKEFLLNIVDKAPGRLAIKTRIGHTKHDELQAMIPFFNSLDLQEVTIHPRTAKDLYKGKVNLERFGCAMQSMAAPIAYSGDICSTRDLAALKARFPEIKRWFLGRGGIRNPLLPARLSGRPVPNLNSQLHDFYLHLVDGYRSRGLDAQQTLMKVKALCFYQLNIGVVGSKELKRLRKEKNLGNMNSYLPGLIASIQEADKVNLL